MKITILGSGTCVPRLERSSSALLVETGGQKIAIDMGSGTIRRLLEAGVTPFDLDHLLITHFHPDHTAELVPLLFATKYQDIQRRTKPLHIWGGNGLKRFYRGLQAAYGDWIVPPQDQVAWHELDTLAGESFHLGDVKAAARPVNHRPESLAYRLTAPSGKSMVVSGDTDECDTLPALATGADLLICESALPDASKAPGHLTPSLAGRMAQAAQAGRLVLTHLYPECDQVDIAKQAASTYKGPVVVAQDLMSFIL